MELKYPGLTPPRNDEICGLYRSHGCGIDLKYLGVLMSGWFCIYHALGTPPSRALSRPFSDAGPLLAEVMRSRLPLALRIFDRGVPVHSNGIPCCHLK